MKELWDECVNWLVAGNVLDVSLGQRLNKLADLAIILRDGVLLCELALKLMPDCIDRSEMFLQYEENQRSPFMRAKNISLFLDVCRSKFGLTQLFNGNDLYDLEDFGRVLHVISLLSHSEQAAKAGLRPFPETNQVSSTDESIYCNLQDEVDKAGQTSLSFSPFDHNEDTASVSTRPSSAFEDEENHYGFIGTRQDKSSQRERLYDTIVTRGAGRAVFRHSLIPTRYLDYRPTNKRGHCIKELLDTESRYCDMLERFIENFYNKLRNRIGADDMNAIFINIKDIHRLHQRFLAELIPAVLIALSLSVADAGDERLAGNADDETNPTDESSSQISDVFCRFKLDFIPYAHYCSRLKSSTRYIDELERSQPEIRKFIAELNSQVQSQFNLRDLLAIPFQRLLKYPLLLKEMMDASADVVEQQRLDEALEAMRDISNYCNEMKRDYEKTEVISIIERSIVCGETRLPTPFVEWCGRLLQDGLVRMADHDDGVSNRPKQRYAFLFEKNLIVCKQKSNGLYDFRRAYVISEYELPDGDGDLPASGAGRTNSISRKLTATLFDNTALTLVRRGYASLIGADGGSDASPFVKRASLSSLNVSAGVGAAAASASGGSVTPVVASVQMLFKNAAQRESWRKMLRTAIELNNPPIAAERGHSLLYKTYTRATQCSICKKLLAGKFYQGYHCSGCSINLHFECCKHLQFCASRRRLPSSLATTGGMTPLQRGTLDRHVAAGNVHHTRARSHSAIHFASPLTSKFQAGDLVVATRTVVSSIGDTCRLSFNADDLIEIVNVQPDTGAITACLNGRPDRVGLVSADCIERTSETLRKMAERDRRSTSTLTSAISTPSTPALSILSAAPTKSLVSKKIIHLSEERGVCELADQPWYFGQCTRADADRLLTGAEDGTFLVRYSADSGRYAISLRYEGIQKHIRIEVCSETGTYYLCDWRFFKTISELVAYYRKTNLDECFPKVHAVLGGTPLKGVLFRALNAYERQNHNDHYLALRPGDLVTVLRTCTDNQGWWLGRINDRIGYFPLSYVQSLDQNEIAGEPADERPSADGPGYAYSANGMRHEIRAQPNEDGIRPPPPYPLAAQFPTLNRHLTQMSSMRTEFPSSSDGQPITIRSPTTTTATTNASIASTNPPPPRATNEGPPQKHLLTTLSPQEFAMLKRRLQFFDADASSSVSLSTNLSSRFPADAATPADDYETASGESDYAAAMTSRPTPYYVNHSVAAPPRVDGPPAIGEPPEPEVGSVV